MRPPLASLPLAAVTAGLILVVPGSPLAHLDDPSYWGVLGYLVALALLFGPRLAGRRRPRQERRVLLLFLVGMPVVYLADWLRFGGGPGWLAVELAGAALYWTLAWRWRASVPWLAAGIAAHGLWDLAHWGRTPFVPDWYALGCFAVDLALALHVLGDQPRARPPVPAASPPT